MRATCSNCSTQQQYLQCPYIANLQAVQQRFDTESQHRRSHRFKHHWGQAMEVAGNIYNNAHRQKLYYVCIIFSKFSLNRLSALTNYFNVFP